MNKLYIAVHNKSLIAQGELTDVIKAVKADLPEAEPYLFDLENGKRIDIDWRGELEQVIEGLPVSLLPPVKKRGRPKLGVISKEVTLLPEHWEWLGVQRGGASITLRRLIDTAMNTITPAQRRRILQDQLYTMMRVFEDEAGFEAASRALYRLDGDGFSAAIAAWPDDLQEIYQQKFSAIIASGNEAHDTANT